jgi:hypothetical protein
MRAFEDPNHEGNSAQYHTGKKCIDCDKPAGTWWSKLWCFDCNVKRMTHLNKQFDKLAQDLGVTRVPPRHLS